MTNNQTRLQKYGVTLHGALLVFAWCTTEVAKAAVDNFYERPGVIVSEILKARGYLAEDFFVDSMGGEYKLRVTRGRNPLINGGNGALPDRVPILFLHGILEDANAFVINSFHVRPSDWRNFSFEDTPVEQLIEQFGDQPASKSLPLLALNLGHEVWVMSRRGFPGSQNMGDHRRRRRQSQKRPRRQAPMEHGSSGSVNRTVQKGWIDSITAPGKYMLGPLSAYLASLLELPSDLTQVPLSFSSSFYNFSLDEQAIYDLPTVVDFVLSQTDRPKTALVAHSAGGAITLMTLSTFPEMADKLTSATLWSEAFSLGDGYLFRALPLTLPILDIYVGSFPPSFIVDQLEAFLALICSIPFAENTLCEGVADILLGPSGFQEPLKPEYFSSILGPTSPHELAQLVRAPFYKQGMVHHFDFLSKARNQRAYGQDTPPPYDLSRIKLGTMSFYVGATDAVVAPSDVTRTIAQLTVPHRYHLIDTTFNHQGYFYHKNNSRLVVIPSMKEIVTLARAT